MAKKGMQIKYKSKKRERNKNNVEVNKIDSVKSFSKTLIGVIIFLGVMYLCAFGMQKLGVFEAGYTKPSKEETKIDYEYINVGTVFNRNESEYYVLFDNFENGYSSDSYVNYLLTKKKPVYKVDMSKKENQSVKGKEANKKASNSNELSINDITLIKIKNGKIDKYIVGSEDIEEYLK